MTIYIDIIFLENILMNYIIIFATSVILKIKVKQIRIIFGSIIGSIHSVLIYLYPIAFYSNILTKIILSIIIVYISFNAKNIKNFLNQLLIFYLTTFAFGGTALSMIYFVNPSKVFSQNGVFQGLYPIKIILLGRNSRIFNYNNSI